MHLSRLLLLSLMVPACVLPVAAQSAANPGAAATTQQFRWLTPPADSRTRIPALTMKAPDEAAGSPGRFSLDLSKPNQLQIASSRLLQRTNPGFNPNARHPILVAGLLPPQNRGMCYSMRTYRFERESPAFESTRFKDYSTCQSGAQFQAKTVVSSGMIPVR
jgi:hypothetical protein